MRKLPLLGILLLAACIPSVAPDTSVSLRPYLTATSEPTNTPDVLVIIETPVPTSTQQIYIVQQGDVFSKIAEKFNVSQDDLRAANPDVNPNTLSIGETLIIPDPSAVIAAASTPTPLPAPVTQAVCHPTADSGLWCFAIIQNDTDTILENISARINLLDESGNTIASQTAFPPLDLIAPESSLPVYVYFPNITLNVKPQVQLLSAMLGNASLYLPAILYNTTARIDSDGSTAQLGGEIHLLPESAAATQVWVAAVAYDKNGIVVGLKRWEGGAIQPGETIRFEFEVASLGGVIEAVEFFVQARP